jgi:hypothetical protein
MTALLASELDCTSDGMGGATTLNAWSHMERKKSPDRNAPPTVADKANEN